jgi:hypothetical protein
LPVAPWLGTKSNASATAQWRLPAASPSLTGALLPKQLSGATGNFTTGFSAGCSLSSIRLLPDHCLMHHRLIKRHGKNSVAYLNIFDYLAGEAIHRNLHFLTSSHLISLLVVARF